MKGVRLTALTRPWGLLDDRAQRGATSEQEAVSLSTGAVWLYTDAPDGPLIDERPRVCCLIGPVREEERLYAVPFPQRGTRVFSVTAGDCRLVLDCSKIPSRPSENLEPANAEGERAKALLDRVKSVWARLRDVEAALADPERIWLRLTELWLGGAGQRDPGMDIIVQQASRLRPTLDLLDRAPRRILRRTRQMVPLARVQEVDRRSMVWLIRQPGESIAERAGDRQRIQAVVREENFNTLENRVLLSYARMANYVARDYRNRNERAIPSARLRRVVEFGKRCRALDRDLQDRGVTEASADATPNFVLQNNPNYHLVWQSWQELLQRGRILDELWRWQARSWEEFCALLVIIALQSRPDARMVAVSPLEFREEQQQGCWIEHVNPLAVFYLSSSRVTVEVSYRARHTGAVLPPFGAPIWLRLGRIDSNEVLVRWAIWPVWDAEGGLDPGEADRLTQLPPYGQRESVRGGITLRPAPEGAQVEQDCRPGAGCFTVGTSGTALKAGIEQLGRFLQDYVLEGVG